MLHKMLILAKVVGSPEMQVMEEKNSMERSRPANAGCDKGGLILASTQRFKSATVWLGGLLLLN